MTWQLWMSSTSTLGPLPSRWGFPTESSGRMKRKKRVLREESSDPSLQPTIVKARQEVNHQLSLHHSNHKQRETTTVTSRSNNNLLWKRCDSVVMLRREVLLRLWRWLQLHLWLQRYRWNLLLQQRLQQSLLVSSLHPHLHREWNNKLNDSSLISNPWKSWPPQLLLLRELLLHPLLQ